MNHIKRGQKPNLSIHDKIRKAAFVPYKYNETEKFKYKVINKVNNKVGKIFISCKRYIKKFIQKQLLLSRNIKWSILKHDFVESFITVVFEGFTANIATHYLFGLSFNFGMILAHGIAINQGISIFWRLKKNGSNTEIHKENE